MRQINLQQIDGMVMKTPNYALLCLTLLLAVMSSPASAFYEFSADGTEVLDPRTSLIWRRCAEGMQWDGTTCVGKALEINHENALRHAAKEASRTGLAWRLPNTRELNSLFRPGRRNPTVDVDAFPATPFYNQTWSSTPDPIYPDSARIFSFSYGNMYSNLREFESHVRLVRDAQF